MNILKQKCIRHFIFVTCFIGGHVQASHTEDRLDPVIVNGIFNVADFGAHPNDELSDDEAAQKALAAAQRTGGTLLFPSGVWNLEQTLILSCDPAGPGGDCTNPVSKPIQIHGANIGATRIISSASPAVEIESGYIPKSIIFQDFWLSGNAQIGVEQHGIYLCNNNDTVALTIERVHISTFINGDGICARGAYNARIVQNRIESVRTGIRCEECRISMIENNRVGTFFERGIFLGMNPSNPNSKGSISVRVTANEITHVAKWDGIECAIDSVGIQVGRGHSVQVETNYFEAIRPPVGCPDMTAVGILIKPEAGITRNAIIKGNFWSGNNGNVAINVDELAHNTVLESTGGDGKIVDEGLATTFQFHQISEETDPKSFGGTNTTRRGWLVRNGEYTTPPPDGQIVKNPIFQLHDNTEF
ncbi:MAG: right-handed parallel beta-helix repeat-containing protein [Methylococcales bacterium]